MAKFVESVPGILRLAKYMPGGFPDDACLIGEMGGVFLFLVPAGLKTALCNAILDRKFAIKANPARCVLTTGSAAISLQEFGPCLQAVEGAQLWLVSHGQKMKLRTFLDTFGRFVEHSASNEFDVGIRHFDGPITLFHKAGRCRNGGTAKIFPMLLKADQGSALVFISGVECKEKDSCSNTKQNNNKNSNKKQNKKHTRIAKTSPETMESKLNCVYGWCPTFHARGLFLYSDYWRSWCAKGILRLTHGHWLWLRFCLNSIQIRFFSGKIWRIRSRLTRL